MDKAEEIFAEGIEDRNVKTIRQARVLFVICLDLKSTRLNSSHPNPSRMPSSA